MVSSQKYIIHYFFQININACVVTQPNKGFTGDWGIHLVALNTLVKPPVSVASVTAVEDVKIMNKNITASSTSVPLLAEVYGTHPYEKRYNAQQYNAVKKF